jgi:hypothetical protein
MFTFISYLQNKQTTHIYKMGFWGDLWSGIKSLPGKAVDLGRKVIGKVSDGIGFVKNIAGKIGNIPVIGDIARGIMNHPYLQKAKQIFDQVDNGTEMAKGIINSPAVDDVVNAIS